MTTKESLRAHALELASRHGYAPEQTLKAAREYHDFLSGVEAPKTPEWLLASLQAGANYRASAKRAPAKKASPRKRA